MLLWALAYILFILEIGIALSMEKSESSIKNMLLVMMMYFTYCQLWLIIALRGVFYYFTDWILKKEAKWYKTERF
jgi:hypothetical protein